VGDYDPWADLNDDGKIDMRDVYVVARKFGTTGTPINKTALLLELNATVHDLKWKMDTEIFQSGLLLQLPYGATMNDHTPKVNSILHWLDLDKDKPGNQTVVFVPEGATITVAGKFQVWEYGASIGQEFFIYSWTPSWPPPNSTYYYPLYNDIPGSYPGDTRSFSFDLTVPNKRGIYYLYYCTGTQYSMEDAVNQYTQPLWVPYAIITVCSSP